MQAHALQVTPPHPPRTLARTPAFLPLTAAASIVRVCGRVFGEWGDVLHCALLQRRVVLYHPDAVNDYVHASVAAHVIAHAAAAAVGGRGERMMT